MGWFPAHAVRDMLEESMRMRYEVFRGTLSSWETLFKEASEFASSVGRERVINISHSCDHSDGVVTVWYWE